ncbi:MAG: TlpA family protein disulfide reductase [Chloroflexia bacterium]|nr:TlpA family protein disulfide reductase [Chloroflexia bacterium]
MVIDAHDAGQMSSNAVQTAPEPEKRGTANVIRTRVIPILAGSMVVGLLSILAYALFAPASARMDSGQTVTESGIIVYDDPKPASNFELANFDGSTFQLSDYRGQIVVLNFWASWCVPCLNEMPMLDQAAAEFAGSNVVVVGVNVWDTHDSATKFLDRVNVSYPIIEDDNSTSLAVEYGVTGVPETFVVNADGEIATYFWGEFTNTQQIRDMVALAR